MTSSFPVHNRVLMFKVRCLFEYVTEQKQEWKYLSFKTKIPALSFLPWTLALICECSGDVQVSAWSPAGTSAVLLHCRVSIVLRDQSSERTLRRGNLVSQLLSTLLCSWPAHAILIALKVRWVGGSWKCTNSLQDNNSNPPLLPWSSIFPHTIKVHKTIFNLKRCSE